MQKADGPHSLRFEVWDYNKVLKNVLMGVVDVNLEELPVSCPAAQNGHAVITAAQIIHLLAVLLWKGTCVGVGEMMDR